MKVNFYVTCIGDAVKANVAKQSVLLLEKLGCEIIFLEKQGCCGQPATNGGFVKDAIPGMKASSMVSGCMISPLGSYIPNFSS